MMCWIATLVLCQVACALRAPVARHPHAQRSVAQRMERLGDGEQTRGTLVGEGGVGVAAAATGSEDEAGPPQTMAQCLQQATASAVACLNDGNQIMEVEFPPLPAAIMESESTSAAVVANANTKLAVKFAEGVYKATGKRMAICYPDAAEAERAVEESGSAAPAPGVLLHSLRKPIGEAPSLDQAFLALFGRGKEMIAPLGEDADGYVCLTFSAQELPDVEELCIREDFSKPVILFNLKLDTQRGDLGLPAFPPKDLQWRFLSRVKPAYFLRTRQYSLSLPKPPFVVNYQGALFRAYPGNYQCLLDTGKTYRPIEVSARRPALGAFKNALTDALRLSEENKAAQFARTGFKSITWWEEDKENLEENEDWRL